MSLPRQTSIISHKLTYCLKYGLRNIDHKRYIGAWTLGSHKQTIILVTPEKMHPTLMPLKVSK